MHLCGSVELRVSPQAPPPHTHTHFPLCSHPQVLGEGSFGKVYKGLWRGTEVAIKTMMLAANMSGEGQKEGECGERCTE